MRCDHATEPHLDVARVLERLVRRVVVGNVRPAQCVHSHRRDLAHDHARRAGAGHPAVDDGRADGPAGEGRSGVLQAAVRLVDCPTNPARQPTNPTLDVSVPWTPGPEAAMFGRQGPARPSKTAIENRFTVDNAKAA